MNYILFCKFCSVLDSQTTRLEGPAVPGPYAPACSPYNNCPRGTREFWGITVISEIDASLHIVYSRISSLKKNSPDQNRLVVAVKEFLCDMGLVIHDKTLPLDNMGFYKKTHKLVGNMKCPYMICYNIDRVHQSWPVILKQHDYQWHTTLIQHMSVHNYGTSRINKISY